MPLLLAIMFSSFNILASNLRGFFHIHDDHDGDGDDDVDDVVVVGGDGDGSNGS